MTEYDESDRELVERARAAAPGDGHYIVDELIDRLDVYAERASAFDLDGIHDGDRDATLNAIGEQASELAGQEKERVTCPCGVRGPLRLLYRCYYCDVYFCPDCAEEHFED